ncbi:unnamed protein product [Euphydryas editha]|uniref:Uncharacterized protein n=1 Tax=Euphydryas editha TaxID=104508 RepID=A0AAU9TQF5_EUPED|nr:unnamed protein product [Euphydryas editha]
MVLHFLQCECTATRALARTTHTRAHSPPTRSPSWCCTSCSVSAPPHARWHALHTRTLSSYALTLMVLHFLQCECTATRALARTTHTRAHSPPTRSPSWCCTSCSVSAPPHARWHALHTRTLSSYALTLMVLHFLQCECTATRALARTTHTRAHSPPTRSPSWCCTSCSVSAPPHARWHALHTRTLSSYALTLMVLHFLQCECTATRALARTTHTRAHSPPTRSPSWCCTSCSVSAPPHARSHALHTHAHTLLLRAHPHGAALPAV